jgi:UDP-glucose 4-epimerase
LNRHKNGESLLVTGDGSQQRDFIHVADLAKANYLAAIHPERLNTSFNIGYGATVSVLDLAKMISSDIQFIAKREGEAEITFADNTKARTILKWEPSVPITEYLKSELQ